MPNDLSPEMVERSHRWHAVECNNLAWELCDRAERTDGQSHDMLHAAHAAAFHWSRIGTDLHRARAEMLLAHVYARLGQGEQALVYARQFHAFIDGRDAPDWELAFDHAVLAHAAYAANDFGLHRTHHAEASRLGEAIADPEDKAIFSKTFDQIPAP